MRSIGVAAACTIVPAVWGIVSCKPSGHSMCVCTVQPVTDKRESESFKTRATLDVFCLKVSILVKSARLVTLVTSSPGPVILVESRAMAQD